MFGGIGKIFSNPTMLMAIATMNPAIIAAAVGKQLISQIGQQVIQQLGQQLGLPQPAIDMAQGAFAGAMGDTAGAKQNYMEAAGGVKEMLNDFFESNGIAPADRGQIERNADSVAETMQDMFNKLFEREVKERSDELKGKGKEGKEGAGGVGGDAAALAKEVGVDAGGFLMKFAILLGEAADKKSDSMMKLAEKINQAAGDTQKIDVAGKKDTKGQQQFQKDLTEQSSKLNLMSGMLNALGKELDTLVNSMTKALEKVGGAQAKIADGR